MNWQTDPFSQGAYSYATVESGEAKKILSKPVEDTLFFAGEALSEGAAMGAVEEALANGMKTARELLASCLSLLRSAYEYERGKIKTVRTAPPIANLTEHIAKLSEADWLHLAERLREKKLIAQKSAYTLKPERGTAPAVYYCPEAIRAGV